MTDRERFEAWCMQDGSPAAVASEWYFHIWQAATRETAQRCAELCDAEEYPGQSPAGSYGDGYNDGAAGAAVNIRREFGLTEGDA